MLKMLGQIGNSFSPRIVTLDSEKNVINWINTDDYTILQRASVGTNDQIEGLIYEG